MNLQGVLPKSLILTAKLLDGQILGPELIQNFTDCLYLYNWLNQNLGSKHPKSQNLGLSNVGSKYCGLSPSPRIILQVFFLYYITGAFSDEANLMILDDRLAMQIQHNVPAKGIPCITRQLFNI